VIRTEGLKLWSEIALAIVCGVTAANGAPTGEGAVPLGERADSAFRAKDWAHAVELFERLSVAHPESFVVWLRLGESLHGLGRNERALGAYDTARRRGAPVDALQYDVAIVRASMGATEQAFESLQDAMTHGHGRPDLLNAEPAFAGLRSDPRFASLVAQATRNQSPCTSRAESRQFDFWIGDWNVVTSGEGLPVGRSHIERTIGDCVIWENWTSLGEGAYSGKSYNAYDAELHRWEQFWVDNQGGMIHFRGNLIGGVMDFATDEIPQSQGPALRRRLRFFALPAGEVRQLSEGSTDGGKSWSVEYDFTYRRAPQAGARD